MTTEGGGKKKAPAWLLPTLMLSGAVLGLLIGGLLGDRWNEPSMAGLVLPVRLMGKIFLNLLKALVVPLIVTSVVVGVTRMGDLRKFGRVAGLAAVFFLGTTFLSVSTGMVLVNTIHPGTRVETTKVEKLTDAQKTASTQSPGEAIYNVFLKMFPSNLFSAAGDDDGNSNILGLIVFSLLFAVVLSMQGEKGLPLTGVFESANDVLLRLVTLVVWLAPIGIVGLIADRIGKSGGGGAVWTEIKSLGWYAATVIIGLMIHAFVTLPLILKFVAKRKPLRYAVNMGDALLTAFGTASSAATMSVTMRCAIIKNKVSKRAADLVIPLGTTVNMDGTALYEAVAVIFIAQKMGLDLSFAQQLIILITATLAAIGAAAIPEAGLVTMMLVLTAVGLPPEMVGMLISIDWILDRFRTTVNVWGDSIGAAVVDQRMPNELQESSP